MTTTTPEKNAAVAMRKPEVPNPYRHYLRICATLVGLAVVAAAASQALPPLGMAIVLSLSIGLGSIALLSGLVLWPIVRGAQRQVEALAHGECLAYWTYPADIWNGFVTRMRDELKPQRLVPLSLFPACGFSAGLVLAPRQHWLWLPACGGLGIALAAFAWWCEHRYHLGRYQHAAGTAEVFITRGMLCIPGNAFVWNRLAPQLLNVTIDNPHRDEPRLIFHIASQAKSRKIYSQIVLPILPGTLNEASAVVAALTGDEHDD